MLAHQKCNKAVIDFPYVDPMPQSENSEQTRIFARGFPWLFPGGVGDISDKSNCSVRDKEWLNRLLHYDDGRFATDKQFCFYALNYLARKQNQSHGGYFINDFYKEGPKTLEELKKQIQEGNTEWINRITYFSKTVKGSTAFWRHKRKQLFSWINHHIKENHGPPTLFMTFSCAEYRWPDLKRLIKERMTLAGEDTSDFDKNYKKHVNDYTIVTQEYFQLRLKIWLETVGKQLFKIEHYWLRFEFAPSRGQIHAHMLAIIDKTYINQMFELMHECTMEQKAELLSMWIRHSFKMTASIDTEQLKNKEAAHDKGDDHPSDKLYTETINNPKLDETNLQNSLQMHFCSKYCLKKKRNPNNGKMSLFCTKTQSFERTPQKGDTKGYPCFKTATIVHDGRGFDRIELPQNHPKLIQTSMYMSRSWRANTDCQVILYDNKPTECTAADMVKVIDYIVSYLCKGTETQVQERAQIKEVIMRATVIHDNENDMKRLARHIMNNAAKDRVISKAEAMCHFGNLSLTMCSELIHDVSVSGQYKIATKSESFTSFVSKYANRKDNFHMTMDEYFHHIKNKNAKKTVIPHYIGGRTDTAYPVTSAYARSVFLIHTPWTKKGHWQNVSDKKVIAEFMKFVNDKKCPTHIKLFYEREKQRHENKTQFCEPTLQNSNDFMNDTFEQTDPELDEVMRLSNMLPPNADKNECFGLEFDTGTNYDWSLKHNMHTSLSDTDIQNWLNKQLEMHRENKQKEIKIPMKNGKKIHNN